jgi:hypothetical protein
MASGADAGVEDSRSGTSAPAGIAHRNRARAAVAVDVVEVRVVAVGRPPDARTSRPAVVKVTATVPSRSVRNTRAPASASRSSVARAGWP